MRHPSATGFKVTRSWVYDEVEAGHLPWIRIGRQSLRFCRSEPRLFLQARSRQPRNAGRDHQSQPVQEMAANMLSLRSLR